MSEISDYNRDAVELLEGLEGVRERPAMYIGSVDKKGFHHLVHEVVDNAIDEALAGYCEEIKVNIHTDGSLSVVDDGRGIPVGEHSDTGRSTVETIMTSLHAGAKFEDSIYQVSGGLHGVGVSAVNALSEWLEVTVKRDGSVYQQKFERGLPQGDLEKNGKDVTADISGTKVQFKPDPDIFEVDTFDFEVLETRLRELAFLNSGVKITITDERDEVSSTFQFDGGIEDYVEFLNEMKEPLYDEIVSFEDSEDNREVAIAFQSTEAVPESLNAFVNNINTRDGGTHITGFKKAVTRVVNQYAKENDMLDEIDGTLDGSDIREGLTAVISIKHPDPQFEGQTKTKLGNSEMRGLTERIVNEHFSEVLERNQSVAKPMVEKAVQAAKARQAAKEAEKLTRRKNALESSTLPGKLSDCKNNDPAESELFITEGDSAGGSAKQGRNPERQAILPLRGKILNVERHRLSRILENDTIQAMVAAIGTGVDDDFDISDARYERIFLMVDADVDGAHIRTLLLTFFYRYMKPLIENGYIYTTQPPLYRIRNSGATYDVMSDDERDRVIEEVCDGEPDQVQRFKGLGEMNPGQLWDTTMNPETRILDQITLDDAAKADKTFSVLMGDQVAPRREYIQENAENADWVDI